MRTRHLSTAIFAAATLLLACEKPPVAQAAVELGVLPVARGEGKEYQVDTEASAIYWIGTKVTGKHNGTIGIKSGSVFVKDGNIVAGKLVADMPTIDTKDLSGEYREKLNKHLRSDEFFDVAKFPEGIFTISSILKSAKGFTIRGNLTLKAVTHGLAFDAEIDSENGEPKRARASFNINRRRWAIVYPGKPDDLISDTVNLRLDLKLKS